MIYVKKTLYSCFRYQNINLNRSIHVNLLQKNVSFEVSGTDGNLRLSGRITGGQKNAPSARPALQRGYK